MSSGEKNAIAAYFDFATGGLKPFDISSWVDWVGGWGISRALFLSTLFIAELMWLMQLVPYLPLYAFNWLVGTSPIWLPIILITGTWRVWIWYAQSLFLSGRNPILLEMRIPQEINKSPRAMEIAFSLFSISSGETTFIHRAWKGQVRPYFSFEMASLGGEIHFYIWCWKNYKTEVESAIYGQYPEVELHEVEDYASKFEFDPKVHAGFAAEWRLECYHGISADNFHINAYQPRTYVDFELDKDPKEEFKVDPFATVLEFIGNIEPHEQIWVQHIIRKSGKKGVLWPYDEDHEWMHAVEEEVEKIRTKAALMDEKTVRALGVGEDERQPQPRATWKQTEQMRSLERHLGKYPFEYGGRAIYISGNGHLHGPTYTGMRWLWKPIGNPQYLSQLRPRRWHCDFDYPWQDVADMRFNNQLRRALDAFRRRSFFHTPWILPTNVLTNETLATLWHPPSSTVKVPGLRRIPSTKSSAPANLPK